jgi:predicted Zn-dependent peptidase
MQAIESRGGQMNAFTGREATCYYVKSLPEHVGTSIEILGDIICNPVYQDMEKERNVILEEIASIEDTPDEHVFDLLSMHFWPNHALGRPVSGFHETVQAMSREDISDYKETWYRPENIVVMAVGRIDDEAIAEQVEKHFTGLIQGSVPSPFAAPTRASGTHPVEQAIGQHHVAMAFPAGPIADPGRYRYDLMSCVLGGGSTSRLFESIREEAGLAYAVYSYHSAYRQAGVLGFYAAVGPENLEQALSLFGDELKRLKDELIAEDELNSNREQLKGSLLFALEGTFNRMTRMARSLLFLGRIVPPEEILENINAITADDIQALARETFTADNCSLTVLGPKHEGSLELAL